MLFIAFFRRQMPHGSLSIVHRFEILFRFRGSFVVVGRHRHLRINRSVSRLRRLGEVKDLLDFVAKASHTLPVRCNKILTLRHTVFMLKHALVPDLFLV